MDSQELTLKLTKEEGQQLYELIDLAVKAGGVQVSRAALPIVDKLMTEAQRIAKTEGQQEIDSAQ